MECSAEVLLVSRCPLLGRALSALAPERLRCTALPWPAGSPVFVSASAVDPGGLILLPECWEDVELWLPALQARCAAVPWVILGDPRIGGLFLSRLEAQPWAPARPEASMEELEAALGALRRWRPGTAENALVARFAQGARPLPGGLPVSLPTPREVQYGCAVSLGLSNHRTAEVARFSEETVKSHLRHLFGKLELHCREALGEHVEQALRGSGDGERAPPPPKWGRQIRS